MLEQQKIAQTAGETVPVIYVRQRDTKTIKTLLEERGQLDKRFRVEQLAANVVVDKVSKGPIMAIPVDGESKWMEIDDRILGNGLQSCRHSAAWRAHRTQQRGKISRSETTLLQQALRDAILTHRPLTAQAWLDPALQALSVATLPHTLQLLGDMNNRIVILPRAALQRNDAEFASFCQKFHCDDDTFDAILWSCIAQAYASARVVRQGPVDANSAVRASGYVMLWPPAAATSSVVVVASEMTPSAGWICVTENGIRQSFDLTQLMFSRGNITEKMRFGQLVQSHEHVLDLYAGIGYFALPALVHGHCAHLTACEWNPLAVHALEYNLRDNGVDDARRVTVLPGDCRRLAVEHDLVHKFDRVSLGLLPSSEGGWPTAVRALRVATGGWLHVHGNVPVTEVPTWTRWVVWRLLQLAQHDVAKSARGGGVVVVCRHVEKVKSFAPTVCHYVADCFVGPALAVPRDLRGMEPGTAGVYVAGRDQLDVVHDPVVVPSCALSDDGPLHQPWMR